MLKLHNINKVYRMGDNEVYALENVSLEIAQGDYVAIMGPSGSGKSTLMNILGLLDVPTSGSYQVLGQEVASMKEDELAVLRREVIGFIFQQFNLLPRLSATENVALPLMYSKRDQDADWIQDGAYQPVKLLDQVGLGARKDHRPSELSGGQQQRVAIARALVNHPQMILADEPTGNLDSKSEAEIMAILRQLNEQGITVIVVTHEEEIGRQAKRLIKMRDGKVQSDERLDEFKTPPPVKTSASGLAFTWHDVLNYFKQGGAQLMANKIRSCLSMLGILIGVGAVVGMLALGRGAQIEMEKQFKSLGSNLLVLRSGARRVGGVAQQAGAVARLTNDDIEVLKKQVPGIRRISASVNGRAQIVFKEKNRNTRLQGANADYAQMHASVPTIGRFFTNDEDQKRAKVAVIGMTIVRELFPDRNPIGEMVKINRNNFQVIGVLPEKGSSGFFDQDDIVLIPVRTAMYRMLGTSYIGSAELEMHDGIDLDDAEKNILNVVLTRHRVPESQRETAFEVRNMADLKSALSESGRTMSILLSAIAAISLVVGGIGIMNIMLVSVTERTREIGLRKAIGARRRDILVQFLTESIEVSVIGGVMGIILGYIITFSLSFFAGWSTSVSPQSILLAFGCSATIGIVFGIYPAYQASMLHPIEALRHE